AHQGLGIAYAAMGRPRESRQEFLRAREIYRDLDHHGVIAICYLAEMRSLTLVFEVDNPEGRRALAREAVGALAQAGGALPVGTSARPAAIACLILDGEWDTTLEIINDHPDN